jgi:DNA replication protein DnaC
MVITCEKHGSYEVEYLPWITDGKYMVREGCQKCIEEDSAREAEKENQERKELFAKRLLADKTRAGLNKRHIECRFENYRTDSADKNLALTKSKAYLDEILSGSGSCLVMAGKVGTGKTHLAASMVNVMIEKGKQCKLVKMSELIRSIKSTWARSSEKSESDLIKFYSEIPLLLIDEIGIQFGSDTEKLLLSEVIDNRYQDILPTVLISNLDTTGIKDCIGDRSYDRLRQDGGKIIAFDWESERAKA